MIAVPTCVTHKTCIFKDILVKPKQRIKKYIFYVKTAQESGMMEDIGTMILHLLGNVMRQKEVGNEGDVE